MRPWRALPESLMPPASNTLYTACQDTLDAVVTYYGAVPQPLPDRQYVSDGPDVAWDCEQVVVGVDSTYSGLADVDQPQAYDISGVRSARIFVEIIRCAITIHHGHEFPDPAEISANAAITLADPILLPAALRSAVAAGLLSGCHSLVIDTWTGEGPNGGYVGGRLTFIVQMDNI